MCFHENVLLTQQGESSHPGSQSVCHTLVSCVQKGTQNVPGVKLVLQIPLCPDMLSSHSRGEMRGRASEFIQPLYILAKRSGQSDKRRVMNRVRWYQLTMELPCHTWLRLHVHNWRRINRSKSPKERCCQLS